MLSWFGAKSLPYVAVVAIVAAVYGVGYSHGRAAVNERVERDRADELTDIVTQSAGILKAVNQIEQEGQSREARIVKIRVPIPGDGCKPPDGVRVRFQARQRARDAIAGLAGTMPPGMPASPAHERP